MEFSCECISDVVRLRPPQNETRTNARPDAGRMFSEVRFAFTMVPVVGEFSIKRSWLRKQRDEEIPSMDVM
jgi:hypothetical protein